MYVHKYIHIYFIILGLPVPIVAVSVGLSYQNYGIEDSSGNRIAYALIIQFMYSYSLIMHVYICTRACELLSARADSFIHKHSRTY